MGDGTYCSGVALSHAMEYMSKFKKNKETYKKLRKRHHYAGVKVAFSGQVASFQIDFGVSTILGRTPMQNAEQISRNDIFWLFGKSVNFLEKVLPIVFKEVFRIFNISKDWRICYFSPWFCKFLSLSSTIISLCVTRSRFRCMSERSKSAKRIFSTSAATARITIRIGG